MAADPLARQRGQPAVPAVEQHVELGTGPPPGAGHEQGAELPLQLAAGVRRQAVCLVPRHAEHGREVGALQVVPEVELDDLALSRVQPVEGGADEPAQFGPLGAPSGAGTRVGRRTGQVGGFVEARLRPAQPAVTLVAGHRVEPGPQLARVAQAAEPGGGDDERVLDRVGGVVRITQHPVAVTVQGLGVLVVGVGQPGRVASRDGRDDLAVVHAHKR